MKLYLDCSALTNIHLSGIGIYNKNIFLNLKMAQEVDLFPVLKLSRYSKNSLAFDHLGENTRILPPVLFNKEIIYHGTDHKLNTYTFGPKIVTIHDMQPFLNKWLDPKFAAKRRAIIHKTLTGKLDRIIAVSQFTKQEILKFYPNLEAKIDVVYHGHNFVNEINESSLEVNNLKKLLNNAPFLLFIGNIEERKNIINQIKVFEVLKATNKDLKFVIAGNAGFNFEAIKVYIQNSKEKGSILLTGYLNETEKKFALENTLCLMFATMYEGFGIPVIEALASNSNVLISNNGALVEIAGEYCHSANPENLDELIAATGKIISNGNKVKIDFNSWNSQWSWKKAALDTFKVYKKSCQ